MADIKLFRISNNVVREIEGSSVALEKSLQVLIEKNLEAFLGVRFLATEYSTGPKHGGRVDTLGIDENGCPVIIEYKRTLNETVINQGLYYLDWLLDHKAEFELLVLRQWGQEKAPEIEWSGPRLLCIAGEFTKYDVHAVEQINRNIELIRYRRYGDELLLLELVNAHKAVTSAEPKPVTAGGGGKEGKTYYKGFVDYLGLADAEVVDRWEALKAFVLALGDDVQSSQLKYYVAFKRIKNFACVEIHPQPKTVVVYLKVDPKSITLEKGFTRDVTEIGHFGTGNLEVTLRSMEDLEKAKGLILRSYEVS